MASGSLPAVPRLVDVAGKAGVSVAVASVALRGGSRGTIRVRPQTAERVRRIARAMGYRPNMAAQRLKGRRNDVVGVLIGADSTPANYDRLAAIEREAYGRGYRLMIGQFHGDPRHTAACVEDFLARGIDALICFHNPLLPSDTAVLRLVRQARALVFQTRRLVARAGRVDVDRAEGVRLAVAHLSGRGRSRIGLLLNAPPESDPLMADRLRGYLSAPGRGRRLVWAGEGAFPPSRALADRAVERLVSRGGADAIVASNDVWGIEVIKAARRGGLRVPDDLAVVGFDNLDAAALFDPAMTTIDQNNEGFARAAMDLLLAALEGGQSRGSGRTRIVTPRLVVRESA